MITESLPPIAFACVKKGTVDVPIFQHTAVLCLQHTEASLSDDHNPFRLSKLIYRHLYSAIQTELSKIIGLQSTNPARASERLTNLHRELTLLITS